MSLHYFLIKLACGHKREYTLKTCWHGEGEDAWCNTCQEYVKVTEVLMDDVAMNDPASGDE